MPTSAAPAPNWRITQAFHYGRSAHVRAGLGRIAFHDTRASVRSAHFVLYLSRSVQSEDLGGARPGFAKADRHQAIHRQLPTVPNGLDGWSQPSSGGRTAYVDGFFYGQVGWQYPHRLYDSSEVGMDST